MSDDEVEIVVLMGRTEVGTHSTTYCQTDDPKAPSVVRLPNEALVFLGDAPQIVVTVRKL